MNHLKYPHVKIRVFSHAGLLTHPHVKNPPPLPTHFFILPSLSLFLSPTSPPLLSLGLPHSSSYSSPLSSLLTAGIGGGRHGRRRRRAAASSALLPPNPQMHPHAWRAPPAVESLAASSGGRQPTPTQIWCPATLSSHGSGARQPPPVVEGSAARRLSQARIWWRRSSPAWIQQEPPSPCESGSGGRPPPPSPSPR